ncbi:MAG: metallopeptidase family protein [Candidatus Altimarinota bacterium]
MQLSDLLPLVQRMVKEERLKFLKSIDPEMRSVLKNIPVKVLLGEPDGRLYGDFSGTPYGNHRAFAPFEYASDITIYARGFLPLAGDKKVLRDKVRLVLAHEYGHYLGFSEADLRKRGIY